MHPNRACMAVADQSAEQPSGGCRWRRAQLVWCMPQHLFTSAVSALRWLAGTCIQWDVTMAVGPAAPILPLWVCEGVP